MIMFWDVLEENRREVVCVGGEERIIKKEEGDVEGLLWVSFW